MSYAAAVKAGYSLPAKFGYFMAAWAFLCTRFEHPPPGYRELAMEEWEATPAAYLVHPDLHPPLMPRVSTESKVENKREKLFKEAGMKDWDPPAPVGHH
eukprot:jgi/Chrzof1/1920/Cz10g26100.t1